MQKRIIIILSIIMIVLCGCASVRDNSITRTEESTRTTELSEKSSSLIKYHFASKNEGRELLLSNKEYFKKFNQNDLDYKMQKKGATMDEYLSYAGDQVMDFTDEEKKMIADHFTKMEAVLKENDYTLPPTDEIVLIKTTLEEEKGADAYTHGTQIYISAASLEGVLSGDEEYNGYLDYIYWHELFHCLTRCNPDFRAAMYKLIHFTVADKDFELPPSVYEYHISNPDVEHFNSYATFHIDGKDIDCFTDFVTLKHFEKKGDSFFDSYTTALVPVDGSDIYYTPEQADNFYEVFGKNSGYVIDPEECMADNFSFALNYGIEGLGGMGYPNPEIIEGIIDYLKG